MNWLHGVWFHSWHFFYQQAQLDNWFGNIVAGVVGFVAGVTGGVLGWRKWGVKLLDVARGWFTALHREANDEVLRHVKHIVKYHPDIPNDLDEEA